MTVTAIPPRQRPTNRSQHTQDNERKYLKLRSSRRYGRNPIGAFGHVRMSSRRPVFKVWTTADSLCSRSRRPPIHLFRTHGSLIARRTTMNGSREKLTHPTMDLLTRNAGCSFEAVNSFKIVRLDSFLSCEGAFMCSTCSPLQPQHSRWPH